MITFILKGLLRDRTRSLFPILMVTSGVFLTVFMYSFMQGVMGDLVSYTARFDTGHVKVMTRAYREIENQAPNDLAMMGSQDILEWLRENEKDLLWTERIRFGGILDVPDEKGETRTQGPVMGLGIDLLGENSPEKSILNLENAVINGKYPESSKEILVSDEFAEKMDIKPGNTVTLIGSTMYGAMAFTNFTVTGTVRFGIKALDDSTILADIEDIQYALDMKGASGEIVGYSEDMLYSEREMGKLAETFNNRFTVKENEFSPVMVTLSDQDGLGQYLAYSNRMAMAMIGVFVLAMTIVLWNSGLMNGLRRYGEIGLRLAIGESKVQLYRSMVAEYIVIGIVGSVLGTLAGLGISFYMQYNGINFGDVMSGSTMLLPNIIRARVTSGSYFIGFLPGVFASAAGSMFSGTGIFRRETSQLMKELEI